MWAGEAIYKTAKFGSSYNSKSVGGYTETWYATYNGFRVDLANFNNNNNNWSYVKCGRSSGASTGTITTNATIDKPVTKVVLTIDAITAAKVTSITLYTSSNKSTWTSAGTFDKSTGSKTVSISSPTANLYYKIEAVCKQGSSNGLVTISQIDYYYNAKSDPSLSVSPTSLSLGYGETKYFTISNSGDATPTVTGYDDTVISVEQDGSDESKYNVTYLKEGSTTITVAVAETSNYASDSKEITVTATDGRSAAGIAFASASQSAVIAAGTSFKQALTNPNSLSVTYSSTDTDVATVASDGTVTLKAAGTTTIKATFDGNASYKPAEVSYTLTVTNKYVAELVFTADAVEKNSTDAPFTNAIATDPDPIGVVYSSSDTDVATVNASTGEVTIVGGGTTTITATIDDDDYEATEYTYTLTVNKVAAPISFSSASATTAFDETESFVAPTLSNPQSLTIAYSSSNTSVATVDAGTGAITFKAVGNTTITATSTATAKYNAGEVSYTLTVTKAAEALPFTAALTSSLGDFTVTPDATLGNLWAISSSSAKASAYKNSEQNDGESWLISPYINITSAYATLSFQHAQQYFADASAMKDEATLWIREKGGDWEQMTIATYPEYEAKTTKSDFVSTSNSLSSYSGKKVQIGFKYLGNQTSAGSWFVKNFRVADDREEAPISFATATVYKLLKDKDSYTGQELTNTESLIVSYSSSDTDVATVNASTGVVTIKAVGETDITATYSETASYKANTATYKLVVTSKTAPAIEYADAAVSKKITLGTYTHPLTNPNSLTVAYSSSDETVATVNASTGEVTMLKVGETTITATFTEDEDYDGGTASYTLTVIKDDPTLTFAKTSVNAGLAEGTYTQVVTTTPADLPVTYSSSDETVATVDPSTGEATLLKKGETTITASFAGNDSYNSANTTYTLNVVIDYAELPFSYNSGYSSIASTTGLTQSGISSSDYSTTNTKLKFDGTGDYLILKIAEVPGTLSFSIKGNGYSSGSTSTFKVQTSADGESYSDIASYTELGDEATKTFNLAGSVRYIKWIYTKKGDKSGGNVGLGNISLTPAALVTITAAEYATYCNATKALDFTGTGITAYTATDETTYVKLHEITSGQVPANTPVVLYKEGADGTAINVPVVASADAVGENDLNVVGAGGLTGENNIFVLSNKNSIVGFYLWDKTQTLNEGKIYLQGSAALARSFLGLGDETTGIKSMNNGQLTIDNEAVYDLQGRKVAQPTKGLYIVNGRKVVLK